MGGKGNLDESWIILTLSSKKVLNSFQLRCQKRREKVESTFCVRNDKIDIIKTSFLPFSHFNGLRVLFEKRLK